jgi:hypothetical protein
VASLFTPAAENRTFEVVARDGMRDRPDGVVTVDWREAPPSPGVPDAGASDEASGESTTGEGGGESGSGV